MVTMTELPADERDQEATADGFVMTSIGARWGPVYLAASDRGLVAVDLLSTEAAFRARLELRFGARGPIDLVHDGGLVAGPAPRHAHLRAAAPAVSAALDGRPAALGDLRIDLSDRTAWDRAVLACVRSIPWGQTRSYGEVARLIGRPGAARAVGGAIGRNPIGCVIPCHRVIAGDGSLGGYGGGWWGDRDRLLDLKSELLSAEGQHPRRRPSDTNPAR